MFGSVKFGLIDCICTLLSRLNVGVGSTTELTHEGLQFLTQLFDKYDEVCTEENFLQDFSNIETNPVVIKLDLSL